MKRTLVITDVTAMSGNAVCIAGADVDTGETLRLNDPQPTVRVIAELGGLTPGDIIEVEIVPLANRIAPHLEDCRWLPQSLRKIGVMGFEDLSCFESRRGMASIVSAFGEPSVKGHNGNHGWEPRRGERSLATLVVRYVRHELYEGKPRTYLRDDSNVYWANIPFQDLAVRSHRSSCEDCKDRPLITVRRDFEANRTLVRVGLTRPFPAGDGPPMCWLQVTNVLARPRAHFVE